MKKDSEMDIHMGLFIGKSARMAMFLFLVVLANTPAAGSKRTGTDRATGSSIVSVEEYGVSYGQISSETELELCGTLSINPSVARAIIEHITTKNLNPCRIGRTWFEHINEESADFKGGEEKTGQGFGTGFSGDNDNAEIAPSSRAFEKLETGEADLPPESDRVYIRVKRKRMEKMLRKSVIKLYSIGSRVEGLRITGLNKQKGSGTLGLKDGDIIRSVNGHRLTSKGKAYRVFQKTKSLPVIHIELLRRGEIKRLRFAFQ